MPYFIGQNDGGEGGIRTETTNGSKEFGLFSLLSIRQIRSKARVEERNWNGKALLEAALRTPLLARLILR